jgi:ribonuclease D
LIFKVKRPFWKLNFHEKKRLANIKWGTLLVPPQQTNSKLLEFRKTINRSTPVNYHPFKECITTWRPTKIQFQQLPPPEDLNFKWVDSEVGLVDAVRELNKQLVVAFDTESNCEFSYLGMTCLIQVCTYESVFIFDCLSLFDVIEKHLGPLFSNQEIIKLVLDAGDVTELQRDFGIFCQSVIDIQELYHVLNPNKYQIGMKDLVLEYFGDVIDKMPQLADWRVRPLCQELIDYAANDVVYLIRIWYLLLPKVNWNLCTLERSKSSMLKLYRTPNVNPSNSFYSDILKFIPRSVRSKFDCQVERRMYEDIFNWRQQTCALFDWSVSSFISKKSFALVLLNKPQSTEFLCNLVHNCKAWPKYIQSELLSIVSNKTIPSTDRIPGTELENTCEIEIEIAPGVSLPEADITPENIQYVIPNDVTIVDEIMTSDEDEISGIEITIENEAISINDGNEKGKNFGEIEGPRSGKTLKNFLKRKKLKANRLKRNEERLAMGLQPCIFRKSRGIKRDYGRKAKRLALLKGV